MKFWMIVRVFDPMGMGRGIRGRIGGGSGTGHSLLLLMIERRLLLKPFIINHILPG